MIYHSGGTAFTFRVTAISPTAPSAAAMKRPFVPTLKPSPRSNAYTSWLWHPTHPNFTLSVRSSMSEMSVGDADSSIGSIIHAVEPLKPRLAIDEIETQARNVPEIANDEVDAANVAADRSVQRPRPYLSVWRELEFGLKD